jgi:putative ABC transport system substrate-binding protein
MNRRDTVLALLALGAAPRASFAQQVDKVRQIGVLMGTRNDAAGLARATAFSDGLKRLGWFEGKNVRLAIRWTRGQSDLINKYATELVSIQPDVIMCGSTPALIVLRKATQTVPIVFVMVSDPVGMGHVASMARPGGNVTGFTAFEPSLGGKWVQLLKEIDPRVMRVGILFNPNTAANARSFMPSADAAGKALRVSVISMPVRADSEIEHAIAAFAQQPGGGVAILPDAFSLAHRKEIIAAATRHHLPMISPFPDITVDGAMMSYGIDIVGEYRRAASYVDRILRGEKPADLPVQIPTRYQFIINLKAAKALGITIPPAALLQAEEVIE